MIIKKQFFSFLWRRGTGWRQVRSQQGQTLVEYALILAVISVLIVGSLVTLQGNIKTIFSGINSQVTRAPQGQ